VGHRACASRCSSGNRPDNCYALASFATTRDAKVPRFGASSATMFATREALMATAGERELATL